MQSVTIPLEHQEYMIASANHFEKRGDEIFFSTSGMYPRRPRPVLRPPEPPTTVKPNGKEAKADILLVEMAFLAPSWLLLQYPMLSISSKSVFGSAVIKRSTVAIYIFTEPTRQHIFRHPTN
ncbi:hypothetical protein ACTXT7_003367 [Hymenolepis weldensis]